MNTRENFLNTIEFRNPEWIPVSIGISPLARKEYGSAFEHIEKKYNIIFESDAWLSISPLFKGLSPAYYPGNFTDSWGCIWHNNLWGLEGQIVVHPLKDWKSFKTFKAPDPMAIRPNEFGGGIFDWKKVEQDIKDQRKDEQLIWGNGERLFDRLYFLRGFENLMMDFATENKNLPELIEILYEYEKKLTKKWIDLGVDIIWFHTDIGTQSNLMISPPMFRKYLKEMYKDLFTSCRNAGIHVYLSSDGRIIDIVDDLIECGISMHDPQGGVISIDEIKEHYKGKTGINFDLDRQKIPFYKPEELDSIIKNCTESLNSSNGGLMLLAGICDATGPIEIIDSLCQSIIKYCF